MLTQQTCASKKKAAKLPARHPLNPAVKRTELVNEHDVLLLNCSSNKNKFVDFTELLDFTRPSIVRGTEYWLDETISDAEVFPSDYVAYRHDRNSHGGGVFLLIHSRLQSIPIDFSECSFEFVWCSLSLHDGKFLVIGSFYRPPACSDECIQTLWNALSSISFDYLVLGGDFSFPGIRWDEGIPVTLNASAQYRGFVIFVSRFALHQHVTFPTRFRC